MRKQIGRDRLRGERILIVDDESANIRLLTTILSRAGYDRIESTTDSREAVALFRSLRPDLVLLDLHMPHMNGFEVMEALEAEIGEDDYLPILVLTADQDTAVRQRALRAGARDFLTKPFEITEVVLRIRNLLETRFLHRQLALENESLEAKVLERTRELGEAQVEIVHRLAVAAEYRDDITGRHAERVGVLSSLIALSLGLPFDDVRLMRRAAPLHDVGKIGIPDAILMKPGPLTNAEFEVMRTHTVIGGRILSGSRYPLLKQAREIALHHHEWWDGTGYHGIQGEEIPLSGRIVAVADVFDSLTHERPYKRAMAVGEAVDEIVREGGAHFDYQVVEAFLEVVERGEVRELDSMAGGPLAERSDMYAIA